LFAHGGAEGEEPHAGELAVAPIAHCRARIRRQHVGGKHAGEALRMCGDGVGDVGVVVAVAGRGLHDRGLPHAGLVHRRDHLLQRHRPRPRPVRLFAAERDARVAPDVAGDDMRMDINGGWGHRAFLDETSYRA
jgi:hypothetical protein